jgi:hypothetical protein
MKKCAFCTRPADSREHIFSDWMLQMLPPEQRYIVNERIVTRDEYIRYQARKIQLKAKVVCTPCNNGWMSDLEGCLKPVFQNILFDDKSAVIFGPKELAIIAAYGFKTLVLANHKDLNTTPFLTRAQRFLFRRKLCIPNGVQIWMATRKVIPGKFYGFWKSINGGSNQPSRYAFSLYVCTWNFQNIVLQILSMKWKDNRRRKTVPMSSIVQPEWWNDAAIQIWPLLGGNIQWPPPAYLVDEALLHFRDRFDRCEISFP